MHLTALRIMCTEYLDHIDRNISGIKMFFRVVILVFAATCCTARVIGKFLYIRHWYTRSATDADVKQAVTSWLHTLDTDLFCMLALWRDKCLNANGENSAVWPVPLAAHLSFSSAHIRMMLSAAQSLLTQFYNRYIRSLHTVSYRKFCCRIQGRGECVGAEWQVRR